MRRREFIIALSAAPALSARRLWADHHFVSFDPLVVEFDLASLKGRYTRAIDFYIRNHYETPMVAEPAFISIGGEVENPLRLNGADISRLPDKEVGSVLECAGDPVRAVSLVSDGLWRGHLLADLVSPSRPKREARYAHIFGHDGFARSVPAEWLINGGFLATSLNGSPLPRNHGAPWRALFPGWYGVNSVKWLEKITFSTTPLPASGNAYLELWKGAAGTIERKPLPPVQVKSVITSPANGAVLHAGHVEISGLAWSGCGKIVKVEISVDGGSHWQPSVFDAVSSRYDWVRWRTACNLNRAGAVQFISRASDSAGNIQPSARDPRRIDYYAYNVWDRIQCVVV